MVLENKIQNHTEQKLDVKNTRISLEIPTQNNYKENPQVSEIEKLKNPLQQLKDELIKSNSKKIIHLNQSGSNKLRNSSSNINRRNSIIAKLNFLTFSNETKNQLIDVMEDKFNLTSLNGWVVIGYESNKTLTLQSFGDSIEDLRDQLKENEVQYILLRIPIPKMNQILVPRDIFITWVGSKITNMVKVRKCIHEVEMKNFFSTLSFRTNSLLEKQFYTRRNKKTYLSLLWVTYIVNKIYIKNLKHPYYPNLKDLQKISKKLI